MQAGQLEGAVSITESSPLDQQGAHKGPERAGHLPGVTEQSGIQVWRDQESKCKHGERCGGTAQDPC